LNFLNDFFEHERKSNSGLGLLGSASQVPSVFNTFFFFQNSPLFVGFMIFGLYRRAYWDGGRKAEFWEDEEKTKKIILRVHFRKIRERSKI